MSTRRLLDAFDRWRAAGTPLVLVTVVDTAGSTYTKPGHRILIAADGRFEGLVSGGCLEGDLAEHARDALAQGTARVVTYDLRGEQDELFGLGIGCNGLFRVLLQPLTVTEHYEPFATIAGILRGETATTATIVYETDSGGPPVGTTWIGAARHATAAPVRTLVSQIVPLPRLVIAGAGLDAVPLAALAHSLDWRVTVCDHRPANLARGDFAAVELRTLNSAGALGSVIDLDRYHAAIVMTHHLDSDRVLLGVLARSRVPFIGLLGPAARRDRLLAQLEADAAGLLPRLHAPVGLAIGADSPESIALAIVAQLQASGVARAAGATR